jgi:hypothetical protein
MTAGAPRRPAIFGAEPWARVAGRSWCHWDLWYCLVFVLDHSGDLDRLEALLVAALRDPLWSRQAIESKLSHLADLRERLRAAGLEPAALVSAEARADRALVAKARRKLAERGLDGRALTPAMVETPRVRLVRRARTGRWAAFPVDPGGYYRSFRRTVELKQHVAKGRSFAVAHRLEERLGRLDKPGLAEAERLALYRAFHTAGLELADRADDSYGVVGELRREAWHTYLHLDWEAAGMAADDYWADLCELVVFEDYALDYKEETLPWSRVPAGQAKLIEDFLLSLEAECRSHYLDYPAEEARRQLAWLAVARCRFRRYVEVAALLGSDHWREIEALAESALRAGRRELAVEVFCAADRPGWHRERLRERCLALTGVEIPRQEREGPPALRVVP